MQARCNRNFSVCIAQDILSRQGKSNSFIMISGLNQQCCNNFVMGEFGEYCCKSLMMGDFDTNEMFSLIVSPGEKHNGKKQERTIATPRSVDNFHHHRYKKHLAQWTILTISKQKNWQLINTGNMVVLIVITDKSTLSCFSR